MQPSGISKPTEVMKHERTTKPQQTAKYERNTNPERTMKPRGATMYRFLLLLVLLAMFPGVRTAFPQDRPRSIRDWSAAIDSIWGQGVPTDQKLSLFDTFVNTVSLSWGGFHNLSVNWDSLRDVYRPIVAAGVSRGRFYGILTRLNRALNEVHTAMKDFGIDHTFGYYFNRFDTEYPNYPSFRYRPGVPMLNLNAQLFRTCFGAGVTALPDGSALVYSVMPSHPLGLAPGDIILGYDGVPWRQLIEELYDAELPALWGGAAKYASSPLSFEHSSTLVAGMNWGLFDTIDIAQYATGDTLHLPTSLLASITPPYFVATEQMPVNGVPFPDLASKQMVSWGVVEGTNIGYIYVLDWDPTNVGTTATLFSSAVDELWHDRKVEGLILDFRSTGGGLPSAANGGFGQLFNVDPTRNYSFGIRSQGADRLQYALFPSSEDAFTPTPDIFDRPIAVLTGPTCVSGGEYNAFRMRFHPMVRFFGKPTNGGYIRSTNDPILVTGTYHLRVDNGFAHSNVNGEGPMIHKPFPVDEEVWLTRDGVARGEDDVVKRAMGWIASVTHAHDIRANGPYLRAGIDSLRLTASLANPLSHQAFVSAVVGEVAGGRLDSVLLFDDGMHGDGAGGDGILGNAVAAPAAEGMYTVSINTEDVATGVSRRLPDVTRFTTAGPVTLDSIAVTFSRGNYLFRPFLRNNGSTYSVRWASVSITCEDPWANTVSASPARIPLLAPGSVAPVSAAFAITPDTATYPGYFNVKVHVGLEGWTYWSDSTRTVITSVGSQASIVPASFALDQNYPNPFNPATVIPFEIGAMAGQGQGGSRVRLAVYDLLGREVATLVDEKKSPGRYEAVFNAAGLASGTYIYRLTAGDYTAAKKLTIVK